MMNPMGLSFCLMINFTGLVGLDGRMATSETKLSLDQLLAVAKQGDAAAQHALGVRYGSGEGVAQDRVQAAFWFLQGSEKGYAPSQLALGECYSQGLGVPQDFSDCYVWASLSAAKGFIQAAELRDETASKLSPQSLEKAQARAKQLFEANAGAPVADESFELLGEQAWQKAGSGDADGQYLVGLRWESANSHPVEAARWIRRAAEKGLLEAQGHLGWLYLLGNGVPVNYVEGFKWCRMAAGKGNALGQAGLGHCFGNGRGVARDYSEAYVWLSLAALRGDRAEAERDHFAAKLTPEELDQAQKRARAIFDRMP